MPGNATGAHGSTVPAYVAAQVGIETAQAASNRANVGSTLFAGARGTRLSGRPARIIRADVHSPQRFVSHPRLVDAVSTAAVGADTGSPALPGRVRPAESDGEPGWRNGGGGV